MKKTQGLWLFIGLVVIINITLYITRWGGEKTMLYLGDLLPVVCSLISAILLFQTYKAFKEFDAAKLAWLLIFIGIALNFLAETAYAVLEIIFLVDVNTVFPTIADYLWCTAYFALFGGLVTMFVGYKRSGLPLGSLKVFGLLILFILILFSTVIYFLLIPILSDPETNSISKFFYMFYPIGDLLLVFPTLLLMHITSLFGKGTISRPWKFLAFGFIFFTLADLGYSYLSWLDLYDSGNPIDIAWNVGYLLIGVSGLYQVELIKSIN